MQYEKGKGEIWTERKERSLFTCGQMWCMSHGELIMQNTASNNPFYPFVIHSLTPCKNLRDHCPGPLLYPCETPDTFCLHQPWSPLYSWPGTNSLSPSPLVPINHLRLGEPPVFPNPRKNTRGPVVPFQLSSNEHYWAELSVVWNFTLTFPEVS